MPTYNLTNMSNATGYVDFLQKVNTNAMGGWYGVMVLITITIIAFIAFVQKTNDPRKAFAGAMMISFGLCLLLRAMELVPNLAIFITLLGAAGAVAMMGRG